MEIPKVGETVDLETEEKYWQTMQRHRGRIEIDLHGEGWQGSGDVVEILDPPRVRIRIREISRIQ